MEKNAKRTGFDCSVDIECAIEMLKKIKNIPKALKR